MPFDIRQHNYEINLKFLDTIQSSSDIINSFDLVSAARSFFIYFREFHCTLVVEY